MLALATLAASAAAPAQGMDPSMPMNMPMPAQPPAKKAGKPAKKPAAHTHTTPSPASAPTHAMAMPMPAQLGAPGQAPAPMDHAMPGMTNDAMPGMDMSGMSHAAPAPVTPVPPPTDAERAAAFPPLTPHPMHDNDVHSQVLFDRFEVWNGHGGAAGRWDGTTWIGTDLNRVWIRSEGERSDGRVDEADVEVLYGHSVATWWNLVAGVRHDIRPGAAHDFLAVGAMGLAPGKFEIEATGYVGSGGQTSLRLEAQRDLLLTNRLILQPLVEINAFGRDDPRRGIGSGLSTIEAGLRLRYEIDRRFAPYLGLVRERAFGGTAEARRADGEDVDTTRLVAGIHFWF